MGGRAGQKGHAVALICEKDTHALKAMIEVMKRTNQNVPAELEAMAANAPRPPPSGKATRGPPVFSVDPNFKAGICTGEITDVPTAPPSEAMLENNSERGGVYYRKGDDKGKGKGK